MAPIDLKDVAEKHLEELYSRFPLKSWPQLEWRAYRVSAGMAYYREGVIGLSSVVLRDPDAVRETLGHEYAHLLAFSRAGTRGAGHGAAWRTAMRDIGLEPKVRHNYEVERNVRRQQVDYLCVRCGATIARKRRLPGRRKYVHSQCGGDLKLLRIFKVI
jgi:predicted SprT family Zn-dependent metalloprotease